MKESWICMLMIGVVTLAMAALPKRQQTNVVGLLISLGSEPLTSFGVKLNETNTLVIHPAFQQKVKGLAQTTYEWKGYVYTGQELLDGSTSPSMKKVNMMILSNHVYLIPMKWKKVKSTNR